jgi:hypothetical protein
MLLCGIIEKLEIFTAQRCTVPYFFCQATDERINKATSVLRGLIYLLLYQQPYLTTYVQRKREQVGKSIFEDTNSMVTLSDVFSNILQDPALKTTVLVIDALDECTGYLLRLLDFITKELYIIFSHLVDCI